MMEVVEYGPERIAAGPAIGEAEEIILVEGRADVLNLLKHGFKNVIAMNGTSCPQTVRDLTKKKTTTVFVDGDRGGNLIIRELLGIADIDFVCKAPDGKEVEEITKKEIHKALRGRVTAEQAKLDLGVENDGSLKDQPARRDNRNNSKQPRRDHRNNSRPQRAPTRPPQRRPISANEKKIFKETMENLFGTRGACIFDPKLNILGKVPLSELASTVKSLNGGIYAVALDGSIEEPLVELAGKMNVSYLIGTSSNFKGHSRVSVLTDEKLN